MFKKILSIFIIFLAIAIGLITFYLAYNKSTGRIHEISISSGDSSISKSASADEIADFKVALKNSSYVYSRGGKDLSLLAKFSCFSENGKKIEYSLFKSETHYFFNTRNFWLALSEADKDFYLKYDADSLALSPESDVTIPIITVSDTVIDPYKIVTSSPSASAQKEVREYPENLINVESKENKLQVEYSKPPVNTNIIVYFNDQIVFSGSNDDFVDFIPPHSGKFKIEINCFYEFTDLNVNAIYIFNTEYADVSKNFEVNLDYDNAQPGEIIVLTVSGVDDLSQISVDTTFDFIPHFYIDDSGNMLSVIPISVYTTLGEHSISVTAFDETKTEKITVIEKEFEEQQLTVDESTADETINNKKALEEFSKIANNLRAISHENLYFKDSEFIWPVNGSISTTFGVKRFVNGSSNVTRHNAIDFSLPEGTPVLAANDGAVVFSGFLELTGNSVVIEHGYGLKTWYFHMSKLDVSENDIVIAGQKIGEVGSTGFSTGPHLHLEATIGNVAVNPASFIGTSLLSEAFKN